MGDRSILGSADVSEQALTSLVADHLGVGKVQLLSSEAQVAEYDLEALTTAGRYWVRGTARHTGGTLPYAVFVKVVQSWTRTAAFAQVPEPVREIAAQSLPWRTEPDVYRSDLALRLPAGLTMPRALAVIDLDDLSSALWLEGIDVDRTPWRMATFERAAYLLGRLAASPAVRPVTALGTPAAVRSYAQGRAEHQVIPALRGDALWRHPLVASTFSPELRRRLLAAADALPALVDELELAPLRAAHGDACPRNLLVPRGAPGEPGAFVLIDFGFWCEAPLGFDLGQLLLGEMQVGERPADELVELERVCLPAYVAGLNDEGCDVGLEVVRRAHALLMLLFWGLSAPPLEVLFGRPPPGGEAVIGERARAATFVLDLVAETSALTAAAPGR